LIRRFDFRLEIFPVVVGVVVMSTGHLKSKEVKIKGDEHVEKLKEVKKSCEFLLNTDFTESKSSRFTFYRD